MQHLNVLMDGASLADSWMAFQMTGEEWQKARWPIVRLARGTAAYWMAICEKVGMERLIHKGMPDGQKTGYFAGTNTRQY